MEYLFGPQHRAVMGRGWSSAFCICLQKIKCFIMKKNIVFYYCSVKCIPGSKATPSQHSYKKSAKQYSHLTQYYFIK